MDDPLRLLSGFGTDGTMAGLSCVAKAAGILAGAGLVALARSRRAAATRHLVWFLGLAGALAVLPMEYALPRWGVPVLPPPEAVKPAMASSRSARSSKSREAGCHRNTDRAERAPCLVAFAAGVAT